jgi:hypothetical protein
MNSYILDVVNNEGILRYKHLLININREKFRFYISKYNSSPLEDVEISEFDDKNKN